MAGGFPYYMYIEEDIYDQFQQEVDDPNGLFVEDQLQHSGEDESEPESDYEDEDEDDSNEDEEDEVVVPPPPPPPPPPPRVLPASENVGEEIGDCKRRTEGAQTSSSQGDGIGASSSGGECSRSEIDGLFCPICMEAWSNGGDHQVCCLPCGHLYGASCVKKWLQQRKNSGKCPQCNMKCTLKDVILIYASQIVVIDHQLQKKVQSLEAKCTSFEKKDEDWHKKEVKWRRREVDLHLQVHQLTKRTSYLERLLGDAQNRPSGLFSGSQGSQEQAMFGHDLDFGFGGQGSSSNFVLQQELQVDGAKFFDVDASSQIFIIARRLSGMGGMHVLTKMSLIAPHEREDIELPVSTKAVRDLRVAPHGRLALLASLGKKLSVISTESNNVVLSYDLPAAAWSCSWDLNSSHYIYSGLQNGMLLVFDMRQTLKPMESLTGLTCNPIHTVHSLSPDSTLPSGARSLLTASSIGLCQWNFGGVEEGPFLVPESENQGVCIGLAYCPSNNHIVASFRPKVEMSNDMAVSQPSLTAASSLMGQGIQGSNILFKSLGNRRFQKLGSTYMTVNDIRLPKSAIVDRQNHNPQFAYGSEVGCELVLQELPSFMDVQRLKTQKHPIRDVKFTHDLSSGLLSCLSEDILQLFSSKTL